MRSASCLVMTFILPPFVSGIPAQRPVIIAGSCVWQTVTALDRQTVARRRFRIAPVNLPPADHHVDAVWSALANADNVHSDVRFFAARYVDPDVTESARPAWFFSVGGCA